ncbi:plasmid pRiA4b ORF-3 family protein [Planomonospora sp. ID82291]|uniref:plasmid pRiA4b ORF-3 family protein n=1 Tax=Planomonospora sp. ID82291 TaxID=2738136 RepID=UPI0018C41399|nr:plasmid pRiA4b ORF-3 family protein [Planomonospora sp. ID82291]MBG0814629.1 plasmid pRiA4b ORF-3 family protein [Planomonospora sp. ID82291]
MDSGLSFEIGRCGAFAAAREISVWVGDGRAVTPGGALKPALVPQAAETLGAPCPPKVRRLGDVPAVHRAWTTAVAAGLITISGSKAVQRQAPGEPTGQEWLEALEQVLRAQVSDPCGADPRIVCQVTLLVLAEQEPPLGGALREAVAEVMRGRGDWDWRAVYLAGEGRVHPVDRVVEILRDFGALDERMALTALGEYSRAELDRRVPPPITPDLPAARVLDLLAALPEEEVREPVWRWIGPFPGDRTGDPLRELLHAAADATPAGRITAVEMVGERGEYALPLWREIRDHLVLGAHARRVLADLDGGPAPAERDMRWVAVDYALAALDRYGTTDARYVLLDAVEGDVREAVQGSGHPEAERLLAVLPSVPPPIPAYQLKISLYGGLWRRVLVPENMTLGALHEVIRVLFGWGDDHLHVFETAKRRYADPFFGLEECGDEYACRVNRAMPSPRSKMTYVYDLGDCWTHEILLEKVCGEVAHPVCAGGRGDNPIEHYDPEYPEEPVPFNQDAVNERLAVPPYPAET